MLRFLRRFKAAPKRRSQPDFLIVQPRRLAETLNRIRVDHCLLSATIEGVAEPANTAILGVLPERGLIALDLLQSEEAHAALLEHGAAVISGRLDGVPLRFETRIEGTARNGELRFYKASLPEQLYLRERRHCTRIPLTESSRFRGHLERDTTLLSGHCHDFAPAGIGVTLDSGVAMRRGDRLPTCILQLPGGSDLAVTLEVCHVQQVAERGATRFGARFVDLGRGDRRQLESRFKTLERQRAQRRNTLR